MQEHSYERNSAYLLSSQAVALVCGLVSQVILSNWLEPSGYGLVVIVIDLGLTLAILIDFGIPTWIATEWDGRAESVRNLVKLGMGLEVRIAASLTMFALLVWGSTGSIDAEVMPVFFSGFVLILAEPYRLGLRLLIKTEFEAISRALERVLIVTGYLLLVFYDSVSVFNVGMVLLVSSLLTLVGTIIVFRMLAPTGPSEVIQLSPLSVLRSSFPFALATMAYPLVARTDKFILGIFEGTELVGIYNIGWIVVGFGFVVTNKLRQAVLPLLAECDSANDRSAIILKSKRANIFLIITGLFACISVCQLALGQIFPDELIETDDLSGLALVLALLPSWVWSMLCASRIEAIKFHDDVWLFAKVVNSSILVNAISSTILVLAGYSILGVVIGSTISQVFIFGITCYLTTSGIERGAMIFWEIVAGMTCTASLISIGVLGVEKMSDPSMQLCQFVFAALFIISLSRVWVLAPNRN